MATANGDVLTHRRHDNHATTNYNMISNSHAHLLRKKRQTPPAPEMLDAYRSTRHHSSAGATTSKRLRPTVKSMTTTKSTRTQAHCLIHLQHRRRCPAKDPSTTLQAQVFLHQYHAFANKVTMSAIESMNTNYVRDGSAASPVHPLPDHRRKEQWSHFLHALLQVTPWRGRIVMLCIFLITHPAFLTLQ